MKIKLSTLAAICCCGGILFSGCGQSRSAQNNTESNKGNKVMVNTAGNKTPANNTESVSGLPAGFKIPADDTGKKIFREYGALFAAKGVTVPQVVIFQNEAEVSAWQASVPITSESIGGVQIELQPAAMTALKAALEEAKQSGLKITPRGEDAARRNYKQTEELWASRVNPGLDHWVGQGKLTAEKAAAIRALAPFEQVPEIFALEEQKIFFSKDLKKTILYSVAPPGASQHLSMLALDVAEHDNPKVREILARHHWYQTVASDLPHFTYLGVPQHQLSQLGLEDFPDGDRVYWLRSN